MTLLTGTLCVGGVALFCLFFCFVVFHKFVTYKHRDSDKCSFCTSVQKGETKYGKFIMAHAAVCWEYFLSERSSILTRYQWETNPRPTIFTCSLWKNCPQTTFWLCAFQNFVSLPLPTYFQWCASEDILISQNNSWLWSLWRDTRRIRVTGISAETIPALGSLARALLHEYVTAYHENVS